MTRVAVFIDDQNVYMGVRRHLGGHLTLTVELEDHDA